jgi:hypothetical protein
MEGKHTKIVNKSNDDLKNINDTNTFAYSKQDKMNNYNNYNNDYDELAYPFSIRLKLKHEPEEAQENVPVQYTADIIVEIHNRDGTVVPMRALLDTATTATTTTIILREFVGKVRARANKKKRTKWKTLGGTFTTNYESLLDFKFPELSTSKVVTWQAHVDDKTSSKEADYDMIMGMDLMTSIVITVDCEQRCIRWGGTEIPLKTRATLNNDEILHMLYNAANEPDILQEAEKRQNRILDSDYRKVEVDTFVEELKHLTMDEKQILSKTLKKFSTLFGGGLGMLNIKPVRLEFIDGAKPYHARPFPVPQSLEATTKTEMKRLTDIDVFNRSSDYELEAPTFILAKKTGDVRILTDCRRLHAQIRRKPFPLPKISDLLRKLSGFNYATAIDLSMGYYHIPLDLEAQKLCTTILPWGKYQYKRLPMGVKTSPDMFQRIMYELLGDIPNIEVYRDDILSTSNGTFEEHASIVKLPQPQPRTRTYT